MELSKVEFNGVEYEAKGLIEFSSLTKLIFELVNRQKDLEKKFEERDPHNLKKTSEEENKSITFSQTKTFDNIINNDKNNELFNVNEENVPGAIISSTGNIINPEILTKIMKRLKDIEKKVSEFSSKTNNQLRNDKDKIETSDKKINDVTKVVEELQKKYTSFAEEFDNVKVKVQDFNIYDIFKGDSDGGNIDAAKALVMALEQKVFKKFSLYDEKNKKNESDFFKAQEDVKNLKGITDNLKTNVQRNIEKMNEIENNFNEYKEKNDNKIDEILTQLEQISVKISSNPDFNQLQKDFKTSIDKNYNELKKLIEDSINKIKSEIPEISSRGKTPDKNTYVDIIKELNKKFNEIDKNMKNSIDEINIPSIKEKILSLEKILQKKINENEFQELKNRTLTLEDYAKDLNLKVESVQQFMEKIRSDMSQINKKVEYLNSEYMKLIYNNQNANDNKAAQIDTSNFIDLNTFNENRKDTNLKFEKVKNAIDELLRNINNNSSEISRLPTEKDFIQFQNIIKMSLDDLKISCHKKYAEKMDVLKNIRYLETQIKNLTDTYKKMDGSDNWLLAKKPLNNYQCASCEALLKGDLDKKCEFVAWNKYPNRDDKTYRMGHGFSRMLQMVNEEIIKSFENKEGKGYVSDEDKKYNNNSIINKSKNESSNLQENKSKLLPKVKHRKSNSNAEHLLTMNRPEYTSPYEDNETAAPDEPHVTKIYKMSNSKKMLLRSGYNLNKIGEHNIASNTTTKFDFRSGVTI